MWAPAYEAMDRLSMRALQQARCQAVVSRTWERVPMIRDKWKAAGFSPDQFRTLDDMRRIPFTDKEDMRAAYPYGLFGIPMRQIVRLHASSGTTGHPTAVGYTRGDLDLWSEVMARIIVMAGGDDTDIAQVSFGYGMFTGALGLHYGLEKVGAAVIPISAGQTERQLTTMRDFGATILISTPSYALYIADTAERMGLNPRRDLKLRLGLFGGEASTEAMRRDLEARLVTVATQNYGLSEIIGPGVSGECACQDGLHINEDHFYPEIIDPDTGEVLPEGERGELVITAMTREAMPMVRYRTRDLTRLTLAPCACGRTLARHDPILGRSDDMIIVRGVNIFPSQIATALEGMEGIGPHYEIILTRKDSMDVLEVKVELTDGRLLDRWRDLEALEARARAKVKAAIQVDAKITLSAPNTLARFEGKAKRVADLRGMDGRRQGEGR